MCCEALDSVAAEPVCDQDNQSSSLVTEKSLIQLLRLIGETFKTSAAFISLVEGEGRWHWVQKGFALGPRQNTITLCDRVWAQKEFVFVEDLAKAPEITSQRSTEDPLGIHFYAKLSLRADDGSLLGELSILDTRSRKLAADQRRLLQNFAALIVDVLIGWKLSQEAAARRAQLERTVVELTNAYVLLEEKNFRLEKMSEVWGMKEVERLKQIEWTPMEGVELAPWMSQKLSA